MLDIALQWNPATGDADMVMDGTALATDSGLQTSIIISLFTDRIANPGDTIPDGTADRRGWWGDGIFGVTPQGPDPIGSRLWLLDRAKQIDETLRLAEAYALEALNWMIEDGVAGSIQAVASYPSIGRINLLITINQQGGASNYNFAWAMT